MRDQYPKAYLYKRIVQARLYMDAHYHSLIDLDDIADEACFSKYHFIRLFKSIYGKTPHHYLTGIRMEKAKELLQAGVAPGDVVVQVGFESFSSFTSLFKRYTGSTPAAWQKAYLQRQRKIADSPLAFVPSCFAVYNGWIEKSNFEEAS